MFILGVLILGVCLVLVARRQNRPPQTSPKKEKSIFDWLLTGGLAVFVLLVFRLGWMQALLRLQYWVWALLPFLRQDSTQFHHRASASQPSTQMGRAEAAHILGIAENASEIEIQKSYKQLMLKLHPDAGGNGYLAGKLNEARDCLLRQ